MINLNANIGDRKAIQLVNGLFFILKPEPTRGKGGSTRDKRAPRATKGLHARQKGSTRDKRAPRAAKEVPRAAKGLHARQRRFHARQKGSTRGKRTPRAANKNPMHKKAPCSKKAGGWEFLL
jgi:hypothetical protein